MSFRTVSSLLPLLVLPLLRAPAPSPIAPAQSIVIEVTLVGEEHELQSLCDPSFVQVEDVLAQGLPPSTKVTTALVKSVLEASFPGLVTVAPTATVYKAVLERGEWIVRCCETDDLTVALAEPVQVRIAATNVLDGKR